MNRIKIILVSISLFLSTIPAVHAQGADALPHYSADGAREGTWTLSLKGNLADTVNNASNEKAYEAIITFHNGMPIDTAVYRYPGGSLYWRGRLSSVTPFLPADGRHVFYQENGLKLRETTYRDGKKHGVEYSWNRYGARESEIRYLDGEIHGKCRRWGIEGVLVSEEVWNRGKCRIKMFYPGELECFYGKTLYDMKGHIKTSIQYIDGVKEVRDVDGKSQLVNSIGLDGAQLIYEMEYNSRLTNDTIICNYIYGRKLCEYGLNQPTHYYPSSGWYRNGIMERMWLAVDGGSEEIHYKWYPNGSIGSMVEYRKMKKHGTGRYWYPDGSKKAEVEYMNNRITGTPRYWDERGNLVKSIEGFSPE